jgi:ferrous iron transport protein B
VFYNETLPAGVSTDLISQECPESSGILIFYSSNCFLYFYSFLEESGYKSRVVFPMDKNHAKFDHGGEEKLLICGNSKASLIMATAEI